MKKLVSVLTIISIGLLVGACSNSKVSENSKTKSESSKTSTSVKKSSRSKASSTSIKPKEAKQETALWNKQKDEELQKFISEWQVGMGQSYTKYDGSTSLRVLSGTVYPDIFNGGGVYMDNNRLSIGWSDNGEGPYDYNVVAIYNYNNSTPPGGHITYLFAFHNGEPVTLVDQTMDDKVRVHETQNADVKAAFQRIAGKQVASSNATDEKTTREPTFNELAVMTYIEGYGQRNVDVAKVPADRGMLDLYYMTSSQEYGIGQGNSYNSILVQQDGNNMKYWTKDTSNGGSTSNAQAVEHTISIAELKERYFSTPEQQETIAQIASNLKTGTQ
ncbi:DUF4767 domain-containing protein [Lactobacillus sp. AN1001]